MHPKCLDSKSSCWDFLSLESCCKVVPRESLCFTGLKRELIFSKMRSTQQAFQPNQGIHVRLQYRGAVCWQCRFSYHNCVKEHTAFLPAENFMCWLLCWLTDKPGHFIYDLLWGALPRHLSVLKKFPVLHNWHHWEEKGESSRWQMILQSCSDGAQSGTGLGSPVKWWNDTRQR